MLFSSQFRRQFGFVAIVFFCFTQRISAQEDVVAAYFPPGDLPVRVRLSANLQRLQLEGLGFQVHDRIQPMEKIAIPQKQNLTVVRDVFNGRAIWKVQRSGFGAEFGAPQILTEKYLTLRAIDIRQGGKSLPSQIILSPRGKLQFDVIGVLPLENYLVGVLASEMPLAWPMETLKAQAIAARSYALVTMRERARQPFHLESSILDQVFVHISRHMDESPLIQKAKEAVSATEGIVLQNSAQKIVKAYYHSDCGGKTVSSASVWGSGSNTGTAVDEGCPLNPKAQWKLSLSKEELFSRLKGLAQKIGLHRPDEVASLRLLRPQIDDRVQKVEVSFAGIGPMVVSASEFRSAVGFDQLRSTIFTVEQSKTGEREQFVFSGKGFGHGVGLCQWGARTLGRQGKSFTEILEHYYPRTQLFIPKLVTRNFPKPEAQTR